MRTKPRKIMEAIIVSSLVPEETLSVGCRDRRELRGYGNSMATAELESGNTEHVLRKDGSDWKH